MKFKFYASIMLLISLAATLITYGCSNSKDKNQNSVPGYPITINGSTFSKSPDRVIVLSESIADIMIATSNEIKLIGKSEECTQRELKVLKSFGTQEKPNIQEIAALSPDLVICDAEILDETKNSFKDNNINFLLLSPAKSRSELESLYHTIGSLFGGDQGAEKATEVCKKILLEIDDISRLIPSNFCFTACYIYDINGKIATGDTLAGKLIECAGADNIASNYTNSTMEREYLILSDPNFIFCPKNVHESLVNNPDFSSLSAIFANQIFDMDKSLMVRQGKTIIEAVKFMASSMYPENIK